ncbi:MAG: HD-GYP protein [Actinobacteria bacterium]|nr:HD-GYP protein [Actinomycetota bacterium]
MAMERRAQELLITEMIRSLGASLKNRGLYPPSHPQVKSPVEKVFKDLRVFFADRDELALAISDGTLVFEGYPIFNLTSPLEFFVGRLTRIGAPAVIFGKQLELEDLENFIRFLHETKEQGLSPREIQKLLVQAGIAHIRVKPIEENDQDDKAIANEIYTNAVSVVTSAMMDVRMGRIPSGAESERVTRDISSMLTRNRDAMMALTLIKNFDEYTYTHSVNVAVMALAVADAMRLSAPDKINVGVAGLLHDIGKTQLALDLIRKPSTLTVEEFEEIKKHPQEGFVLLGKMSHIRPDSAYIVLEHHLRFDQSGYPPQSKGYQSHEHSNIIPVADCYDALTTMRSYQKARYPQQALEIMSKLAGKSLDPYVVSVISKTLGAYPVGTMVRLNTMEIALVVGQGGADEESPKVVVIVDRNGNPLPSPEHVDLSEPEGTDDGHRRSILATVNPNLYSSVAAGALSATLELA